MPSPRKSYELTFEERPGYLFVRINADAITLETALEYLQEIADKFEELGTRRAILERDIPTTLSDADLYFVVQHMIQIMGDRRLAVVNSFTSNQESMAFATLVSANRGAQYRAFDNITDAEAWIMS
jgi:hypothetical protein